MNALLTKWNSYYNLVCPHTPITPNKCQILGAPHGPENAKSYKKAITPGGYHQIFYLHMLGGWDGNKNSQIVRALQLKFTAKITTDSIFSVVIWRSTDFNRPKIRISRK